jgi:hypothetical protein
MKLVLLKSKRHQYIHIQQIGHGKSARISRTSLLLSTGALFPAFNTGSPVIGSLTIFALRDFLRCGISTIRPASILATSASPAQMPSFLRNGPGNTTCPLVETFVVMVRQSYP